MGSQYVQAMFSVGLPLHLRQASGSFNLFEFAVLGLHRKRNPKKSHSSFGDFDTNPALKTSAIGTLLGVHRFGIIRLNMFRGHLAGEP